MKLRPLILFIALAECVAALALRRMGLEYVDLLIGAAITVLIAELLRPA
ncbi:exported protein of unknown function [Pseudorhizobium banfieldiae]|uniref:Uncharacterized protein n=1 Tax=Pseudorhizobium banfieldiae TaxID=1125847 RepID=L0NEC7_9HYPH|nr:hypothetical protein [Pseudorhizobium banfieldiae]CAD6606138.1 hypothetical protein RNT25_01794 [arsenite-oxidising bacterium NT-25]CCF19141.1 exported protein of unknown function [Pseudorhizobium banfieldiae]